MKHREQRNKVLAKARMQCGARWQDVAILNYSAHGLGLTCEDPPPRGTFIEVRRGPFVIIARVAWTKGHRFGVRTQDPVASVAILSNASQSLPKSLQNGDQYLVRLHGRFLTLPVTKDA